MSPYDMTDAKEDIQILYAICRELDALVVKGGNDSVFDKVKGQLGEAEEDAEETKSVKKKKGFGTA